VPVAPVTGIVLDAGKPTSAPSGPAAEAAGRTTLPAASREAPRADGSPTKIEPVAFPLERAPDDPGAGPSNGKGLWGRLTQ
jgi:HemY protein